MFRPQNKIYLFFGTGIEGKFQDLTKNDPRAVIGQVSRKGSRGLLLINLISYLKYLLSTPVKKNTTVWIRVEIYV